MTEITWKTMYITWYMTDGTLIEFDLTDWKTPLPRFLSLVVI